VSARVVKSTERFDQTAEKKTRRKRKPFLISFDSEVCGLFTSFGYDLPHEPQFLHRSLEISQLFLDPIKVFGAFSKIIWSELNEEKSRASSSRK
jgi:hypothetical protein